MTAKHAVADDRMLSIYGKWHYIESQLRLGLGKKGARSPLDPEVIDRCLQMLGEGKVLIPEKHICDCSTPPFCLPGLTYHPEDQLPGRVTDSGFIWDPAQTTLWLSEFQKNSQGRKGTELVKELADQPVLPANVLDSLFVNQFLIPEAWKKDEQGRTRYIYFWGTIYRGYTDGRCVRSLCWRGGRWDRGCRWLDRCWGGQSFAVLRAA